MIRDTIRQYGREKLEALHSALEARRKSGKGLARQLCEILSLRFGRQELTASEYYAYGLYDDTRFTREAKRRYGGVRVDVRLDRALNDKKWHCITQDKIITYLLLNSLGLPYPRLKAVFDDAPRYVAGVPCLTTIEGLRAFLADAQYPLFAKPVGGSFGRGALAIRGFDGQRDSLELTSGDTLSMDAFLHLHRTPQATKNRGYLFQEMIEPHPLLKEACGDRLCGVRVVAILNETGPRIVGATLKIPTGKNITDNIAQGETGNLEAYIDAGEGKVGSVVRYGPSGSFNPVVCHPDTGVPFVGLEIPRWSQFVDLVLRGASAFPRLRYQHWDVAVSASGPVVLELNVAGEFLGGVQATTGHGWLEGPLRDALDRL